MLILLGKKQFSRHHATDLKQCEADIISASSLLNYFFFKYRKGSYLPGVSKSHEFLLQVGDRKQNPGGISWRFISPQIIVVAIMKQSSDDAKIKLVQFYFEAKSVILTNVSFVFFMVQKIPYWNFILNIVRNFLTQEKNYNNYRGIVAAKTTKGPQRTFLGWELRCSGAPTSRDSVKKRVAAALRWTE